MIKNLPEFLIIPSSIIEDEDLQPLDGQVYGLIYWYTKLKLQKCIASNQEMANLLCVKNPISISNSLTRLKRKNCVRVIMNIKTNQRLEIIPLITFGDNPSSTDEYPSSNDDAPFINITRVQAQDPSSNDEHNKNIITPNKKEELESFINSFNEKMNTRYRFTDELYKKYLLRVKTFSLEDLLVALDNMLKLPFYRGDNDRKWRSSPEYLLRSDENVQRFLNTKVSDRPEYDPNDPGKTFIDARKLEELRKNKQI